MLKKIRAAISFILIITLVLGSAPFALAEDETPTISISQEAGLSGGYKLVFTATTPESFDLIATAGIILSYDNTVIAPVNSTTGEVITVALTTQTTPFKSELTIAPAGWRTSGNRTAFNFSAYDMSGSDFTQGKVICEFYFQTTGGKTTADFDSSTFKLEEDYSEGSFLKEFFPQQNQASAVSLGTNMSDFYFYNYADGEDSIALWSFTYPNSDVRKIASLEIGGIEAVSVPVLYELNNPTAKTEAATVTPTLTVTDTNGDTIESSNSAYPEITWSITGTNPDAGKISINASTGTLSVAPGAKAGIATIQAAAGGKTTTKDIIVNRNVAAATLVSIDGAGSITVPSSGSVNETYTATVLDQYGDAYSGTVTWSEVSTGIAGVSFNTADATIAVGGSAAASGAVTYTIKAECGAANATKGVSIARSAPVATAVTVSGGQMEIAIPGDGTPANTSAAFTASVTDQYGAAYSGTVTWSIDSAPDGISISSGGVVTVSNSAKTTVTDTTGTGFTVRATCGGVSNTVIITVKRAASIATSLVIYNDEACTRATGLTDTLVIPTIATPTEKQYYAKTYDQYSAAMADSYTWTFETADSYVSHNDGKVTVTMDAVNNSTYILTVTGANAKTANVTITVKDIEVDWYSITAKSGITYGEAKSSAFTALPAAGTATAGATALSGTFSIVDAGTFLTAGSQTITVKFTVTTAGDYQGTEVTKDYTVTVNPKSITVIVVSASRAYGATNPTFTATVTAGALVGSDTVADLGLTLSSTANASSAPGNYDVTGNASTPNYTVTISGAGKLTVTKAALTLGGSPVSLGTVLANDSRNDSAQSLLTAVQAVNPTMNATYAGGTSTLDATWTLKSGTFNRKGGIYVYEATLTPTVPANFTYSGTKPTLSVTVTPVTGTPAAPWSPTTITKAKSEVTAASSMADIGFPFAIGITYDNGVSGASYTISDADWSTTLASLKAVNVGSSDYNAEIRMIGDIFPVWATIDTLSFKTSITITNKYPVTVNVTAPPNATYGQALEDPSASQVAIANGVDSAGTYTYQYQGTGVVYGPTATKPVNAGTYKVTALLVSATHAGAGEANFEIQKKALAVDMVVISGTYTYNKGPITPSYTVSDMSGATDQIKASDYSVAITDNINAGNGILTITAIASGNYSGEIVKNFTIAKASIAALTPTIAGTARVGSVLTADLQGISASELTWKWMRDGVDIAGETGKTYQVVPADSNKEITVKAVAKEVNYTGTSLGSAFTDIEKQSITGTILIRMDTDNGVVGTIDADDVLGIDVSGVLPVTARTSLSYQWTVGGVDKGTGATYTVQAADADLEIIVTVTAGADFVGTLTSVPVAVGKIILTQAAVISGTTALGDTLSATHVDHADYAWLRDGEVIVGATGEEYVITEDDLGKTITVRTVGVDTYTGQSLSNSIVIPAVEPSAPGLKASAGNGQVTITWQAPFSGGSPIVGYQVSIDGEALIDLDNATYSYTFTGLTNGTNYTFKVYAVNAVGTGAAGSVSATPKAPGGTNSGGGGGSDSNAPTIQNNEGGAVTVSKDGKTITIKPAQGYQIKDVIINGVSVGAVEAYTFNKASTDNTVEVIFEKTTEAGDGDSGWKNVFRDVEKGAWYYDAVGYVVEKGIMQGTSTTSFNPNTMLSRAMMVQVLYNLEENPAAGNAFFDDVSGGAWYAGAVAWAAGNEIVKGVGNNLFAPDTEVTREQMAVMLYNYCTFKRIELPVLREGGAFADADSISSWAKEAVEAMYAAEILNGKSNNLFDPRGTASRAEVATMLMNFMKAIGAAVAE